MFYKSTENCISVNHSLVRVIKVFIVLMFCCAHVSFCFNWYSKGMISFVISFMISMIRFSLGFCQIGGGALGDRGAFWVAWLPVWKIVLSCVEVTTGTSGHQLYAEDLPMCGKKTEFELDNIFFEILGVNTEMLGILPLFPCWETCVIIQYISGDPSSRINWDGPHQQPLLYSIAHRIFWKFENFSHPYHLSPFL